MNFRSGSILLFFLIQGFNGQSQPGQTFFNYPAVHNIDIRFHLENYWDSLTYYKGIDDQSGQETYITADVVIDGDTIKNSGIRLRGNSSYSHPGTKKPIQIDFNEFVSGQDYDDLKKLNLSNSFLDPTQLREKLFLDILKELGLPAPRCTYSTVYYNGEYVGLYKAIETINKDFLEAFFEVDTGNLYKCEPDMPLTWEGYDKTEYYDNCELRTNETENDWTKLIDLLYLINATPSELYHDEIKTKFNIDSYIKAWAANMVFGNLDSYFYLPHNYYLYENPATGKTEWITWDVSLAFGVYANFFTEKSVDFNIEYLPEDAIRSRPLTYHCLDNPELRKQYFGEICALIKTKFSSAYLNPKIDSLAAIIWPYISIEPEANRLFTNEQILNNLGYETVTYQVIGNIPGIKSFVAERQESIVKQLCALNWSCAAGDFVQFENSLTIYPNPGSVMNIKFNVPSEYSDSRYILSDMMGRIVYDKTISNNASGEQVLDLSHLKDGFYILKSNGGCVPVNYRIVVEK